VTARTAAGDSGVVEGRRLPRQRRMANVALLSRGDVSDWFAAGSHAVMASAACMRSDAGVIEHRQRPTSCRMTGVARIR